MLFIGNLCALVLLSLTYAREWRAQRWRQIKWQDWLTMTLVAVLGAAIVPTLIFTALAITPVNNVILISQVDTPLVLALSVWLLGDRGNFLLMGRIAVAVDKGDRSSPNPILKSSF